MSSGPLAGHGVLVTRPEHQAEELSLAIEAAGGIAVRFPLLEILPLDRESVTEREKVLPRPDLVIYVSPNAVRNGFVSQAADVAVAAIGPTTKAELEARGVSNIIYRSDGFNSESLLADEALANVRGMKIRIVRGQDGRELLGNTLRDRGASVDYLVVYRRQARRVAGNDRRRLETWLSNGEISCITVMSVATLDSLLAVFPGAQRELLRKTRLVTPSSRVLKNITELLPDLPATLAPGPQADDMIVGLITCLKQDTTE